jgi:hypothetical protein
MQGKLPVLFPMKQFLLTILPARLWQPSPMTGWPRRKWPGKKTFLSFLTDKFELSRVRLSSHAFF